MHLIIIMVYAISDLNWNVIEEINKKLIIGLILIDENTNEFLLQDNI